MRKEREAIAQFYCSRMKEIDEIELPSGARDRMNSWHLYAIRLNLERLTIDRNEFIVEMSNRGIGTSVHWRPLHLHPYYMKEFGWRAEDFPVATREWERLISLPLFPGMEQVEMEYVVQQIAEICRRHTK